MQPSSRWEWSQRECARVAVRLSSNCFAAAWPKRKENVSVKVMLEDERSEVWFTLSHAVPVLSVLSKGLSQKAIFLILPGWGHY